MDNLTRLLCGLGLSSRQKEVMLFVKNNPKATLVMPRCSGKSTIRKAVKCSYPFEFLAKHSTKKTCLEGEK